MNQVKTTVKTYHFIDPGNSPTVCGLIKFMFTNKENPDTWIFGKKFKRMNGQFRAFFLIFQNFSINESIERS